MCTHRKYTIQICFFKHNKHSPLHILSYVCFIFAQQWRDFQESPQKVSRVILEQIPMCHRDHVKTLWPSPTRPSLPFLLETLSPAAFGHSPPSCSAQGSVELISHRNPTNSVSGTSLWLRPEPTIAHFIFLSQVSETTSRKGARPNSSSPVWPKSLEQRETLFILSGWGSGMSVWGHQQPALLLPEMEATPKEAEPRNGEWVGIKALPETLEPPQHEVSATLGFPSVRSQWTSLFLQS